MKYINFKKLNSFFGQGNYKVSNNGAITYKSVISDERTIFIRTNDVISIIDPNRANTVRYVFVTGPNKGIYVEHWQFMKVGYKDKLKVERKTTLLKLNVEYSTMYTFRSKEFDNRPKQKLMLWQDLLALAKQQEEENLKVKID